MLRNTRTKMYGALALVALGLTVGAREASAIAILTNTASVNYQNSNATAQPAAVGSTTFTSVSDPVLAVVKTANTTAGGPGTVVTWTIKVTYPRQILGGVDPGLCGDDSIAQNVVVSDPIPAGFTYVAGTMTLSIDGGAPTALTDASDVDAGSFGAGTVSVNLPNFAEGDGDSTPATIGICGAGNSGKVKVITFQATKN